jgi:hypothetical protein
LTPAAHRTRKSTAQLLVAAIKEQWLKIRYKPTIGEWAAIVVGAVWWWMMVHFNIID